MTRNEKIDIGVTIVLAAIYVPVVVYISGNYSGSERWLGFGLFLVCAFFVGRLVNFALARFGLRD